MINSLHLLWIISLAVITGMFFISDIYRKKREEQRYEQRYENFKTEIGYDVITAQTITDKQICINAKENDNLRSMMRDQLLCSLIDSIAPFVNVTAKEDFDFKTGKDSVVFAASIKVMDNFKKSFDEVLDSFVPTEKKVTRKVVSIADLDKGQRFYWDSATEFGGAFISVEGNKVTIDDFGCNGNQSNIREICLPMYVYIE